VLEPAKILLDTPPSLDLGEVTDKGSIHALAVQQHRAALIDATYERELRDPYVIELPPLLRRSRQDHG
jgi:feruloyl-CoA synthase